MKILLINEFIDKGGTEIQTNREFDFFNKMGHDMYLLTFDPKYPANLEGKKRNIPCKYGLIKKIFRRLISNKKNTKIIKAQIDEVSPDIIHINNVWRNSLDVMNAIKGYNVIQTNRDYGSICPKMTCIHNDMSACKGYKNDNCSKCNLTVELGLKYLWMLKYNKLRKKRVAQFVSPSMALAAACTSNGIETCCINNPFDFSVVHGHTKHLSGKKVFLYYGLIDAIKGIKQLLEALDMIDTDGIEVWFVGEIADNFKPFFLNEINRRNYTKYFGKKSYTDIMEMYKNIYCVVVPSLWLENYPNTVLEAIANKTLVIGSNRGGIPELIGNDRFLFDIQNTKEIANCIYNVLNMTKEEYARYTEERFKFIQSNNTPEVYYYKIMELYKNVFEAEETI